VLKSGMDSAVLSQEPATFSLVVPPVSLVLSLCACPQGKPCTFLD